MNDEDERWNHYDGNVSWWWLIMMIMMVMATADDGAWWWWWCWWMMVMMNYELMIHDVNDEWRVDDDEEEHEDSWFMTHDRWFIWLKSWVMEAVTRKLPLCEGWAVAPVLCETFLNNWDFFWSQLVWVSISIFGSPRWSFPQKKWVGGSRPGDDSGR